MKKYKLTELFKTSWQELSQAQFARMLELSEMLPHLVLGSQEYGLLIINVLRTLRKNKRAVAKFTIEQAVDCFNAIKFFRRNEKGFEEPWHFFPVPDFKISRVNFRRPALVDGMPCYYLTFEQFVYADSIFSSFCALNYLYDKEASKELEHEMNDTVHAMVAVLYAGVFFHPGLIGRNAKLVSLKLSPQQCAIITHTYANVRNYITNRCPNLFGKSAETPAPEGVSPGEAPPPVETGKMWQNLLYDLAETEAFKGLDKARNARLYDALDFLEKKAVEANERKTKKEYAQV